MKNLLFIISLYSFLAGNITAQNSHNSANLDIMATVANSEMIDSIGVKLSVKSNPDNEFEIHSDQTQGGKMVLSGTPFSNINLKVPPKTILNHPNGKEAELSDIQLLVGTSNDPSSMEVLSPADCNELSIPESGQLFIRIGAKVSGDTPLDGTYLGSLNFECGTPDR